MVVAHGCGALFVGAELLSMGTGSLSVGTGLLIVGGGACLCGLVVHGCWFVVCGNSGDISSAVWSPLARLDGKRVGVLTINNSMNNNINVVHCLVAMSLLVMWHLKIPPPFSFCCDVVLAMLAVVIVGMGNRCEWWPLVMVMVVVVKRG